MTFNGLQLFAGLLVIVAALYWPRRPIRLRPLNQIFPASSSERPRRER